MSNHQHAPARGFSLVELSIVLVILGLLTGGILAGQSLIRASELRAIGTEHSRWVTATRAFRDKYFGLPGDITNATHFWGKNPALCNSDPLPAGTPGTCNGNGDGNLHPFGEAEAWRFWQQLALAGLIDGSYSGQNGPDGNTVDTVIDWNVPASRLKNAGWAVSGYWNINGDTGLVQLGEATLNRQAGNYLTIGSDVVAHGLTRGATLTPQEAWNIDSKLDDGLPARGNVIARIYGDMCTANTSGGGTPTQNNLDSVYRLNYSTIYCLLYFIRQF